MQVFGDAGIGLIGIVPVGQNNGFTRSFGGAVVGEAGRCNNAVVVNFLNNVGFAELLDGDLGAILR